MLECQKVRAREIYAKLKEVEQELYLLQRENSDFGAAWRKTRDAQGAILDAFEGYAQREVAS